MGRFPISGGSIEDAAAWEAGNREASQFSGVEALERWALFLRNRRQQWPMRDTVVHWATLIEGIAPERYHLRCRTIDANDVAQPMPRPFPKSGNNAIHKSAAGR
jgi:hypothetical protein